MKNSICVLVTGVGGGTVGEQVCKALRFGGNHYSVIAANTQTDPLTVVDADYKEVLPSANSADYVNRLIAVCQKYHIKFIIPGSEPELIMMGANRELIENANVHVLVNSEHVINKCVDKLQTFKYLKSANIHVPKTLEINHPNDLREFRSHFPIIVKPVFGGGSAATFIAQDKNELSFFAEYLLKYGYRTLIQEYFGRPDQEYTIGVLHYPDGTLYDTIVFRRNILSGLSNRIRLENQTGRKDLGELLAISSGISQGEFVDFQPVKEKAEEIASILKSTGPLNIQGRWDGREFIPFEINPRFSGTSSMRASVGFNEAEILINWYMGKKNDVMSKPPSGEFIRGLREYLIKK